jgi:lipopolysaccharide transport system ATP-binding protein
MSDVVVRAENLGKQYRIGRRQRYRTLRDSIAATASAPIRWLRRRKSGNGAGSAASRIWALRDVAFEVRRGDVVGVIGRNGAGKSTLLKVLSQITEPTTGEVEIRGRVGSLLEVGAGFHPELTGRENVFLNGAVLGMKRAEIVRKFDEIIAFAEVEQFIDTPVKRYSSGMYMRLAFAVAAHLEPEILIVDEVLAVGDAEFQKKCLGKMGQVARGGRTVLFVSHNMHAIKALCNRGLVLHQGQVVLDGTAAEGVAKYLDQGRLTAGSEVRPEARPGSGEWRFLSAAASRTTFDPAEPKDFDFQVAPIRPGAGPAYLSGLLVNDQGTAISQFDSRLVGVWASGAGPVAGRLRIDDMWLKPGRYTLNLYVCSQAGIIDLFEGAVEFEVSPVLPYPQSSSPDATAAALVLANFAWKLNP